MTATALNIDHQDLRCDYDLFVFSLFGKVYSMRSVMFMHHSSRLGKVYQQASSHQRTVRLKKVHLTARGCVDSNKN